jgi:hypothetical protein
MEALMGKTLGAIAKTLYGPVSGFIINGKAGAIQGITNAAAALAGPLTYGLYVGAAALQSLQSLPKPDSVVSAIKNPLPPRVRAYGRSKLFGAYSLYVTSPGGVACDAYAFVETGGNAIDGVEKLYLGDQVVATAAGVITGLADGTYGVAAVEIDFRLGHATETAFSQLVSLLSGTWTSAHRGDGVVTGMVTWKPVKAKDYQKRYPNGQPPLSMVARWLRVFDWRDGAQSVADPSTWTWSENPVLHLVDYILTVEKAQRAAGAMFPAGAALTAAWSRYFAPTIDKWTAAADDADSSRALKSGSTEARYRGCVSHKLTDPHKDTRARLMACFDGWVAPREDGALVVYSGRFYAPTVFLGSDEIVTYSLQEGVEDESAVNDIAVTYVSADHDYSSVEAQNWTDESDIIQRGAIRSESLQNDVPSHAQARALAKRKMIQVMAPQRGTVTTNSAGRAARGQRFVHLKLREGGRTFYDGPAEITSLTRNLSTGGVTFNWIAASSAIDDWDPATEEGDPAPTTGAVTPDNPVAPVITSATPEFLYDVGAGTMGVCIALDVTGPNRLDLTWLVRTRTVGATIWGERTYTDIDPGSTVALLTEFVPADASVEVQVSYQLGDGRYSPWSATDTVSTSTAGIAPSPPTDLTLSTGTGTADIGWRNPTSSNFDHAIVYRGTSSSFGSATAVSGSITGAAGATGSYTDTVVAGHYYWWVKAFNASGAGSTATGPIDGLVS